MEYIFPLITALLTGLVTIYITNIGLKKKQPEIISNASKQAVEAMKDVLAAVKEENYTLLKELKQLKNETQKLRKAIEKINICDYADNCPVTRELQKQTDSNRSSCKDRNKGN